MGRELEEFMGAVAERKHGKEVGLDKGEQIRWEVGKKKFSAAILEA